MTFFIRRVFFFLLQRLGCGRRPSEETLSLPVKVVCVSVWATIPSFDLVSDSTPAAVVTEIDEDSAFTETHDSFRVLLS